MICSEIDTMIEEGMKTPNFVQANSDTFLKLDELVDKKFLSEIQ